MPTTQENINCNVLIVDDSYFMRKMLRNILESIGYNIVAEAENGFEAVDKYSKLRPDVILMDVYMPHKGGLEATEEILSLDTTAKVVMCSTLDHEALASSALNAGAKEVIFKPYKVDTIREILHKVMRE